MIEEACNVYADIIAKYPNKEEFYLIRSGVIYLCREMAESDRGIRPL